MISGVLDSSSWDFMMILMRDHNNGARLLALNKLREIVQRPDNWHFQVDKPLRPKQLRLFDPPKTKQRVQQIVDFRTVSILTILSALALSIACGNRRMFILVPKVRH